jgi:transposase-like protein
MSPRKLTENDKQEILEQYRNSQATTSTLAKSYEVSSSTISRFLKNKLSSTEYEDLIQQKRLARTPRGEKSPKTKDDTKKTKTKVKSKQKLSKAKPKKQADTVAIDNAAVSTETPSEALPTAIASEESETESKSTVLPRRRRRSAATSEAEAEPLEETSTEKTPNKLILDKKVASIAEANDIAKSEEPDLEDSKPKLSSDPQVFSEPVSDSVTASQRLILKADRAEIELEDDDDDDDVDIITLKEMLGEDLEDFNDDDDDEEDDDDWEDEEPLAGRSTSLSDVRILPLSQASFPRTCYLVIDRSAELIVKPLSDFADLGAIPQEENRQKTLPVFDNHRIAKRFSHRRERIIKVPDGRMLQKTSRYLQDKGITRLLIDGQIYSLIN